MMHPVVWALVVNFFSKYGLRAGRKRRLEFITRSFRVVLSVRRISQKDCGGIVIKISVYIALVLSAVVMHLWPSCDRRTVNSLMMMMSLWLRRTWLWKQHPCVSRDQTSELYTCVPTTCRSVVRPGLKVVVGPRPFLSQPV